MKKKIEVEILSEFIDEIKRINGCYQPEIKTETIRRKHIKYIKIQ